MKNKKTIFLSLLFLCVFALIFPLHTNAATAKKIVLTGAKNLKGSGYTWDASKQILTLNNAKLKARFDLPETGDVTIKLKGENIVDPIENYSAFYSPKRGVGKLTITGDGTGSLYIPTGGIYYSNNGSDVVISNCIVKIDGQANSDWCFSIPGAGNLTVNKNARLILADGLNAGSDLTIDNAYVEVHSDFYLDIDGSLKIINSGELHYYDSSNSSGDFATELTFDLHADETSVLEILSPSKTSSLYISDPAEFTLLSKEINLSAASHVLRIDDDYFNPDLENLPVSLPEDEKFIWTPVILSDEDEDVTKRVMTFCEKGNVNASFTLDFENGNSNGIISGATNEISYKSDKAIADEKRIKEGVQNTTIKLSSSLTNKGNIKLNWKKSNGYRVDYYEVYRSTKRYSGYTNTPFYKTQFGLKRYYTNTKDLKAGTRYYYKVRGVRVIDGKKYYTEWSNKAWRKAK